MTRVVSLLTVVALTAGSATTAELTVAPGYRVEVIVMSISVVWLIATRVPLKSILSTR